MNNLCKNMVVLVLLHSWGYLHSSQSVSQRDADQRNHSVYVHGKPSMTLDVPQELFIALANAKKKNDSSCVDLALNTLISLEPNISTLILKLKKKQIDQTTPELIKQPTVNPSYRFSNHLGITYND